MFGDLRRVARSLRRSPGSALAAIITLALTLGVGATIVAVMDQTVLASSSLSDPDTLVIAGEVPVRETASPRAVAFETLVRWREQAGSIASLEAVDGSNLTLTGLGLAERVGANDVTPGFLRLLGARPVLGRLLDAGDEPQGVVVISEQFWHSRLGSEPVLGRSLTLGGQPHVIVGILPAGFADGLSNGDFWRLLPHTAAARVNQRVRVIGRVRQGVTPEALAASLSEISESGQPPMRAVAIPLREAIAGDSTRLFAVLGMAAGVTLVAAFVNLAFLVLVRALDRRRELALRMALGGGRFEAVRHFGEESLVIVACGALLGLGLAAWSTPLAGRLIIEQFGQFAGREPALTVRVAAALGVCAAAGALLTWVLPAVALPRMQCGDVLRRGMTPPPGDVWLRRAFVVAEVSLAFLLVASLTAIGQRFLNVTATNPGFDPRGVLTMQVALPSAVYATPQQVVAFYSALQQRVNERLGPGAMAIADEVPLTGEGGRVRIDGLDGLPLTAIRRAVSEGYTDVMRLPLLAGRSFEQSDSEGAPRRVMISEALAQRLFGSTTVAGERLWFTGSPQPAEIVGVVADVKHRSLSESPQPTVYVPAAQLPSHGNVLVARTSRPGDVLAVVRAEVERLDSSLPIYRARPMEEILAMSPGVATGRALTAALLAFGVLALALAAIGVFGVMAHDVARRRTELALRRVVGATPAAMIITVLRRGFALIGTGMAAGGLLSLVAARWLAETSPVGAVLDATGFVLAVSVVVITSLAALLPITIRAMCIDPAIALRSD